MRNKVIFLLLLGANLAAYGQNSNSGDVDLKTCEKISKAGKRAACFEKLARQQALAKADDANKEQEKKTAELVRKLKETVVIGFKDPSSSQFKNANLRQKTYGEAYYLCGEVNAKNSYGGYVGFERFIATAYPNGKMESLREQQKLGSIRDETLDAATADLFRLFWKMQCTESNVILSDIN